MSVHEGDLSRLVDELNRSSSSSSAPVDRRSSLDGLLALASQQNASDLLLVAGSPATLRVNGGLRAASAKPLGPQDLRQLLLPPGAQQKLRAQRGKRPSRRQPDPGTRAGYKHSFSA